MKRHTNLALWLLIALVGASLAVPAAAYTKEGVTLFRDVHFKGRYETFYGDVADLRYSTIGNDRASSLAVPHGCEVTLFRDAGFRGPAVTVEHDIANLRGTRVGNDEVSSLSVHCYSRGRGHDQYGHNRPGYGDDHRYDDRHGYDDYRYDDRRGRYRGVTVFSDADFRGRRERFRYDDPDLRDNRIRQDSISSIHVAPGCRAVLFADVGFRGAATVVTGGLDNLRYSTVGNDRVSSIQVDCR